MHLIVVFILTQASKQAGQCEQASGLDHCGGGFKPTFVSIFVCFVFKGQWNDYQITIA